MMRSVLLPSFARLNWYGDGANDEEARDYRGRSFSFSWLGLYVELTFARAR